MRWTVLLLLAGLAISAVVYFATGGRFILFFLPLVFGLPLLLRRR